MADGFRIDTTQLDAAARRMAEFGYTITKLRPEMTDIEKYISREVQERVEGSHDAEGRPWVGVLWTSADRKSHTSVFKTSSKLSKLAGGTGRFGRGQKARLSKQFSKNRERIPVSSRRPLIANEGRARFSTSIVEDMSVEIRPVAANVSKKGVSLTVFHEPPEISGHATTTGKMPVRSSRTINEKDEQYFTTVIARGITERLDEMLGGLS